MLGFAKRSWNGREAKAGLTAWLSKPWTQGRGPCPPGIAWRPLLARSVRASERRGMAGGQGAKSRADLSSLRPQTGEGKQHTKTTKTHTGWPPGATFRPPNGTPCRPPDGTPAATQPRATITPPHVTRRATTAFPGRQSQQRLRVDGHPIGCPYIRILYPHYPCQVQRRTPPPWQRSVSKV